MSFNIYTDIDLRLLLVIYSVLFRFIPINSEFGLFIKTSLLPGCFSNNNLICIINVGSDW